MINILLTSAGRRSYIVDYFKLTDGIGKVYASNSEYAAALKHADGYFISPLIYSENYIDTIINFCIENNIKAVISLFDIDLLVLSQNSIRFEQNNIRLILASHEFVKICNDKFLTYKFITSIGLKSPKTFVNKQLLLKEINNGNINFPIIIKPRWGMASMGIYKVKNIEELEFFSNKCNEDIFDSYLKYESNFTPHEAVIYQEVMRGEEYGLDVINDLERQYIGTYPKQKVTMRSGETDLGRTADPTPFVEIGKLISKHGRHLGICSVDCFKTDKGIFVIEINCRISGHYPLAYLAGLNYPQLIVDWLNGKKTNPELLKFKENLWIVKELTPTILYEGAFRL